jgi:hypothetical protein
MIREIARLTGFALRTTVGVWVSLLAIGVEVYNILDRGMPWRGELMWPIEWSGSALIVIGPIVAGSVAVDTGRQWQDDTLPVLLATASARRSVLFSWAATTVPVSLVHLSTVTMTLVIASPTSTAALAPSAVAIISQFLAIAAYGAIGAMMGRIAGSVVGPIAGVILAIFAFLAFGRDNGASFSPLDQGSATSSLVGFEFSEKYVSAQCFFLTVTTLGLLALATARRKHRIYPSLAVLAILAFLASTFGPHGRMVRDAEAAPTECAFGNVEVCLYPEHQRLLPQIAQDAESIYVAATRLGISDQLPTSLVERIHGEGRRPDNDPRGRLEFLPDTFSRGTVDPRDVANAFVLPWNCEELFGSEPPPLSFGQNHERLLDALLSEAGYPSSSVATISQSEIRARLSDYGRCDLR